MSSVKISNFPVPFALPVAASINGTETLPVDQTVGGVVTTVSSTFARLLGPISITSYSTGGVIIAAPTTPRTSLTVNSGSTNGQLAALFVAPSAAGAEAIVGLQDQTGYQWWLRTNHSTANDFNIYDNNRSATVLNASNIGLITLSQPSSGSTLLINTLDTGVSGVNVHDTAAVNGTNIKFSDTVGDRGYIGYGPAGFTAGAALTEFGLSSAVGGSLKFAVAGGSQTVMTMASTGAVSVLTPTSGTALTVTSAAASNAIIANGTDLAQIIVNSSAATNRSDTAFQQAGSTKGFVGVDGTQALIGDSTNGDMCVRGAIGAAAGVIRFSTAAGGATTQMSIGTTGQVTISAPTAGQPLNLTGRGSTVAGIGLNTMASTGAAVPTLASNKPGASTSTATWLVVLVDGATRYIPCWA